MILQYATVSGHSLTLGRQAGSSSQISLPTGSENVDYISISFDTSWDDYPSRKVQLWTIPSEIYETAADENGLAPIPDEILTAAGTVHIAVIGLGDGVTISTFEAVLCVKRGGWSTAGMPIPSSSVFARAVKEGIAELEEYVDSRVSLIAERPIDYAPAVLSGTPVLCSSDTGGAAAAEGSVVTYSTSTANANKHIGYSVISALGGKTCDFRITVSDPSQITKIIYARFTTASSQGYVLATFVKDGNEYTLENRQVSDVNEAFVVIVPNTTATGFTAEYEITEHGAAERLKDGIIAENNLTGELQARIGVAPVRYKTSVKYAGKRIDGSLAVGDTFSTADYTYSNLHEIPVPAGAKGVYVETQISTSSGWFPWAVLDADDKILALGPVRSDAGSSEEPLSAGDYIDLTGLADPARIIVRQTSTAAYSVAYFDFDRDKHVIYPGDIIPVTVTGASAVGSTEKGMPVYQYSGNGSITLTAGADVEARTFGVWLKVPDHDDALMMTRLTVTGYKDSTASTAVNDVIDTSSPLANVFCMGEWVFVKVTTKDKPFNKVTIYPTIQSGSQRSISLLVLGGIVADHFARPITVFDMDGTWTATEACGAYDLLIDNGVPWTITGSISVTDAIKAKMIGAYKKGILDIGSYGAEIENNTLDVNASYGTLISRAYSVLEAKLADCCLPTSFGPGNHYASPRLWRALKEAGYTAIKGGATAVARGTVSCDDGGVLFLCGDPKYAMSVGGTALKFYHGISNDPSAESQPSMYTSKAAFGEHVNTAMMFRSSGGMLILNMKQYAEYMKEKKHD